MEPCVVSRVDIASAVQEAASDLVARVQPGSRCWIYALSGALVTQSALGVRCAVLAGGYEFSNGLDHRGLPVTAKMGPSRPGHVPRFELDLHCWFTEVPDGADPEGAWSAPSWVMSDLWLRHLPPVWELKGRPLARRIPPYVWGPRDRVAEVEAIRYRPDVDATARFLAMATSGPESDWWRMHAGTADRVAGLALRKLGLPPLEFTADEVVPQSFMP